MLAVTNAFKTAEKADVNQIATTIQLLLGNYANAAIYGTTATASSTDGSGNYPASGAIDGDRTEINVGAASGADNDVGLSSWRSSTAPDTTPQTLKLNFQSQRKINRIKLYHLASHGLKTYKLSWSNDDSAYTDFAATSDIVSAGQTSITTVGTLDTIDFTEITCQYVKLTINHTQVAAEAANVVEIECYRKVDITSRVKGIKTSRARDYKLSNPIASSFQIICDNSDRFFSPSHVPSSSEITSGFVNSELSPGIGVILKLGFDYGGSTEVVSSFVGNVDRLVANSANFETTIEGRDPMKSLINKVTSSKLKTSADISTNLKYILNIANISNYEMSLDTTGITLDYFFTNNESILTTVRNLVIGSGDAIFYFDESGIATFKIYLSSVPQTHIDSSQADFNAGTVLTNIDTVSTAGQIQRKWFLIDDFTDNEYTSNPIWTPRNQISSHVDTSQADFQSATALTNIDSISVPGQISRKWFVIDDFSDSNYTSNPVWSVWDGNYGSFPPFPANHWSINAGAFNYQPLATGDEGRANISSIQSTGTWQCRYQINDQALQSCQIQMIIMANGIFSDFGPKGRLGQGYCVAITNVITGTGPFFANLKISINRIEATGILTELASTGIGFLNGNYHTIRLTRDSSGNMSAYFDGAFQVSATDNTYTSSLYFGLKANLTTVNPSANFDDIYYSPSVDGSSTAVNSQAVIESEVIDQSATISAEGILTATTAIPSGCAIFFYTATSTDGVNFDAYVAVTNGAAIGSTVKRYIKWKAILVSVDDDNNHHNNFTTPSIQDVTLKWTVSNFAVVSNKLKFAPGTSNVRVDIDTPIQEETGTFRVNIQMTVGSATGEIARMYFLTSGYDATLNTYIDGYYVEVNQAAGSLSLYKIDGAGTRTQLSTFAMAINGSQHSLRVTRTAAGLMTVYWDEVSKTSATDTTFTIGDVLGFEVDPNSDQNGNTTFDDIYFSQQVDGTGAISTAQAVFESQVTDMTAGVQSLGIFQATVSTPAGCSINFFTATSADNVTYDAYVATSPSAAIASAVKRYIKWKAVLICPQDSAGNNANLNTPTIFDVTVNWFTGSNSPKYPSSVSYTFRFDSSLLDVEQTLSDMLGGDTAIINDVLVQAQPLVLSGADADLQWQGTVQTPPVAISVTNPLAVSNGTYTYRLALSNGMDTSRMSGASPAAATVTFAGGAAGTWKFTTISPTHAILQITITNPGNITALTVNGKSFVNSTYIAQQNSTDSKSIAIYGDRQLSIINPYIVNAAIATLIAARIVSNQKNPITFISRCTVLPTFSLQVGDRVTIVDYQLDFSADYIAIGVNQLVKCDVASAGAQTDLVLLKVV